MMFSRNSPIETVTGLLRDWCGCYGYLVVMKTCKIQKSPSNLKLTVTFYRMKFRQIAK